MRTFFAVNMREWAVVPLALLIFSIALSFVMPAQLAFAQDLNDLDLPDDDSGGADDSPDVIEEDAGDEALEDEDPFDLGDDGEDTTDEAAAAKKERDIRTGKTTLWEQFKQSGWVGFVILLLEVAVLTLIIEAFINVNVNKSIPTNLTLELESKLRENKVDEAITICYENPGIASNIVRAGLEAPKDDLEEAKDNIDLAGDLETDNFLHRINFLSVFATIAPMLGLLGTVLGMITVFRDVASEAALGKPEQLAKGINMALLTTAYGLIVGIPAMFMYYYFKIRANKILLAIETGAKKLVKWRRHNKGLPTLGIFPEKTLLGIEEALSDSFVGLFPFLGFLLGPLSIAKGLKVKDEVSSAIETAIVETDDGEGPSRTEQKALVITPEVSANLWKASAAIFLGGLGILISLASLAVFILAVFVKYNIFKEWFGFGA